MSQIQRTPLNGSNPGQRGRIRVTFATMADPADGSAWSGIVHRLANALAAQDMELSYIKELQKHRRFINKAFSRFQQITQGAHFHSGRTMRVAGGIGTDIVQRVDGSATDIVFAPSSITLSRLDLDVPKVFYTDATFKGLLELYPELNNYSKQRIKEGHLLERMAMRNCDRLIYSSEWAARSAVNDYGADPDKVRVVPFGSNLDHEHGWTAATESIAARDHSKCELLLVGVSWERKGADLALEIAEELCGMGLPTRLTVVGCEAPSGTSSNILEVHPFLSKSNPLQKEKLLSLYARSHFLLVPSEAECFGIVYAEASSMSVPSLARDTGGVADAVRSGINGELFPYDAPASTYAAYINELFHDRERYEALCYSAHEEYLTRLNWRVSGAAMRSIFEEVVRR